MSMGQCMPANIANSKWAVAKDPKTIAFIPQMVWPITAKGTKGRKNWLLRLLQIGLSWKITFYINKCYLVKILSLKSTLCLRRGNKYLINVAVLYNTEDKGWREGTQLFYTIYSVFSKICYVRALSLNWWPENFSYEYFFTQETNH